LISGFMGQGNADSQCDGLSFRKRRSSVLVYTNSRADLELKYVYAKLGTSEAYKLCPVDPPPADIDVTNPSDTSIGFHSYEKPGDKIVSTSTTEPSPDCQQLVKRSEVESGSWSGEMSPIEVEGKNLGQWQLHIQTNTPLTFIEFQYGLITRDSSTNFTVRNKFMPVRGVSPSQLFLGTFKAGLARQQGVLDPVFTSIVHRGSELCPPSKRETTSTSNSLATACSNLLQPPSLSRGFWTADLFPISYDLTTFQSSASSNWTLKLELDKPATKIQFPRASVSGVLTQFTAEGSTLAVVAGDSVFLPPFKVFYSGPSRPQIISIVFNDKKLC